MMKRIQMKSIQQKIQQLVYEYMNEMNTFSLLNDSYLQKASHDKILTS